MQLVRVTSEHVDFNALLAQLDADLAAVNGDLQSQYNQHNKLDFLPTALVGYEQDQPIACGCFKPFDAQTIEMKRIFVQQAFRGRHFSVLILKELEMWAVELGYTAAILETGLQQKAAIALYKKLGYQQIDNYGAYINMPNSVCMRKQLY